MTKLAKLNGAAKQRRWISRAALAVLIGVSLTACSRGNESKAAKSSTTTTTEAEYEYPTTTTAPVYSMTVVSPPAGGFAITSCSSETDGFASNYKMNATGTATNPYSASSTGSIKIVWESTDGSQQYGTTFDLAQDLLPGQTAQLDLFTYQSTPNLTSGRCRILESYWYDPDTYRRR